MFPLVFVTNDAEATRQVGNRLGERLAAGDVILLDGDLGAGKTTFTQGIARGLGIRETVASPTFTLVSEHDGASGAGEPVRLYHLDLYRLSGEDDLESFGWEQFLAPEDGVAVVEWPERAGAWLPDDYLLVRLTPAGPDRREIAIEPVPRTGRAAEIARQLRGATGGHVPEDRGAI